MRKAMPSEAKQIPTTLPFFIDQMLPPLHEYFANVEAEGLGHCRCKRSLSQLVRKHWNLFDYSNSHKLIPREFPKISQPADESRQKLFSPLIKRSRSLGDSRWLRNRKQLFQKAVLQNQLEKGMKLLGAQRKLLDQKLKEKCKRPSMKKHKRVAERVAERVAKRDQKREGLLVYSTRVVEADPLPSVQSKIINFANRKFLVNTRHGEMHQLEFEAGGRLCFRPFSLEIDFSDSVLVPYSQSCFFLVSRFSRVYQVSFEETYQQERAIRINIVEREYRKFERRETLVCIGQVVYPTGRIDCAAVGLKSHGYLWGGHKKQCDKYEGMAVIYPNHKETDEYELKVSGHCPQAGNGACMMKLLDREFLLIYGGYNRENSSGEQILNSVHLFDIPSLCFVQVRAEGSPELSARYEHSMAHSGPKSFVIFGGIGCKGYDVQIHEMSFVD